MVKCRGCCSLNINSSKTDIAPFIVERMLGKKNNPNSIECLSCGLLWVDIEPTEKQLSRYYENYWQEEYIGHREKHEPGLRERHAHLLQPRGMRKNVEDFINGPIPNTVLDIGGGDGTETPYVGRSTVHILDVAPRRSIENIEHVDSIKQKYNLVVLAHTLEHVPDPRNILNFALSACKDDGYIYIEVPDEASLYGTRPRLDNLNKKRKQWHEHLNYYDPCSLTVLVSSCGIDIIKLEQFSWTGGPIIRMLGRPRT
jgi:SAM-dependent methyltransferase